MGGMEEFRDKRGENMIIYKCDIFAYAIILFPIFSLLVRWTGYYDEVIGLISLLYGKGRSDVVVYDSIDGRVVIFEAKYSKTIDAMDQDCQAAIKQIDQRMYAKEYEDSCDEVICYGISFYKKRCTILKK